MHLTCIVGARPNFMKMAPILAEASKRPNVTFQLVHTGQHYDERMSSLFFQELGMPAPDEFLGVGSGSHAVQTARVMLAFDEVLDRTPTDIVLVVGDVNSTVACALVATKRGIPVAHIEAGLRSGDRRMPEEINRILTDQISDYLFTTERLADENLLAEGIPAERIHFVGNVMIDTLFQQRQRANESDILSRLSRSTGEYALCTLHRPSNVDDTASAENTVRAIEALAQHLPVVFPVHPRTLSKMEGFGLLHRVQALTQVQITEPAGLSRFPRAHGSRPCRVHELRRHPGGTTALGVPCLTFRENTERPITVCEGTIASSARTSVTCRWRWTI